MPVSKLKLNVKQPKQQERKQRQSIRPQLPKVKKARHSLKEDTATDTCTAPVAREAFAGKLTTVTQEAGGDRAAVALLIRQAYGDENLSARQVADMAYSLEAFSRLCYHLIFGEESPVNGEKP